MSDEDVEIRKAVKSLLKLSNRFQARAMSLQEAIQVITRLPSDGRASLTADEMRILIQEARKLADEKVSQSTALLTRTLESDTPWLPALLAYVSSLLKDE
jgi:hypothetical protein